MTIEFPELGLMLKPYPGYTCWHLYEWSPEHVNKKGALAPADWISTGFYPSTIEHGFRLIMERCARRADLRGQIAEALVEYQNIANSLLRAAERLTEASKEVPA